jgi:hypothetical protein
MAGAYGKQKTFGEKVGSFFRRATLTVIFTGVAGAGGIGYHHYGTKEDVAARVASVEMKPAAKAGEAATMVVHTDKGTFINKPTLAYLKDSGDTAELAGKLRPGAAVKLTVYGVNPKIGSLSLEDFRIYRNITNVVSDSGVGAPVPASAPSMP